MAFDFADTPSVTRAVATAPGSTMLFGEHAVLYGGSAIACALEPRMKVTGELRSDRRVMIHSVLGDLETDLDFLAEDHTHRFILAILRRTRRDLPSGITLTIESGFSHTVGLGSSAALTVAVMAVIRCLSGLPFKQNVIFDECLAVVRSVQGSGSGTDLIASLHGGVVLFRPETRHVTRLADSLPLNLYYCGYKTPTPTVIARISEQRRMVPSLYDALYKVMNECTQQAVTAVQHNDMETLGRCMNMYHGLMDSLGVCDRALADMTYTLRELGAGGVKISGSGLGDCVISLARKPLVLDGYEMLAVTPATSGVVLESDA